MTGLSSVFGVAPTACAPARQCALCTRSGGLLAPYSLHSIRDGARQQSSGERQSVHEVPLREPSRLLAEPVDPLESRVLHPARRPSDLAGHEAEADPDAEPPRPRQVPAKLPDQPFL